MICTDLIACVMGLQAIRRMYLPVEGQWAYLLLEGSSNLGPEPSGRVRRLQLKEKNDEVPLLGKV